MPTLYIDIESRSACNLKTRGAWHYASDPSTEPLMLCWAVDDSEVATWRPGDPVPAPFIAASNTDGWDVIAHNWDFERFFYELILIPRFGFPSIPLDRWHCSMRLALANAYPAELGLLSQALGLPYRKDPEALRALHAVSRPRKNGSWNEDPAKLALVHERCVSDVIAMRACWQHPKLRPLSENERRLQPIDAEINRRGVRIDREFVTAARAFAAAERNAVNIRLSDLTDGAVTSVDQVQKLRAAINARGHELTSLSKRSVAAALAHDPDEVTRQLLTLRRDGARASVRKFNRILEYADSDDRIRGAFRIYGGGAPARWSSPGPQLQNLKRNDIGAPLSIIDAVRRGDRAHIAQFGNPLELLGSVSRATVCAESGYVLVAPDLRMIESRVLAWVAGDEHTLELHRAYDRTGDKRFEVYRVNAAQMLGKPVETIVARERQRGKGGELAAGFGGSVRAWRNIFDDPRPDPEIKSDIQKWRQLHPQTRRFWKRLFNAALIAIRHGVAVRVNEAPLPEIVTDFEDGNLYITLPSGRSLTYPNARLVPGKYEDPDIAFHDNSRKQWREVHEWYGTFVGNVVQGIARDLLAAALVRFEAHGLPVVFHCHDEVVIEVLAGSNAAGLAILTEAPPWAVGLPLAGSVHSGPHYLDEPDQPLEPIDTPPDPVEHAIEELVASTQSEIVLTPAEMGALEREDIEDALDDLDPQAAPLYELTSLPVSDGGMVLCPFHDETTPSCKLFADHFHCFGCDAHGDRLTWLVEAEGMTQAEAAALILDWDEERAAPSRVQKPDKTDRREYALALWNKAGPIAGTWAERYLAETRKIAIDKLPAEIGDSLRFLGRCPYDGARRPCLLALMTAPDGTPCGVHRIALHDVGGKIDRIGRMALGTMGVVRLWPQIGNRLVVGEGLETTLAAATRIPYGGQPLTPAWSAVSTNGVKSLAPIDGVSELILLVDHDDPGKDAEMACSRRWRQAGRKVVPLMPTKPGWDFNDVVLGRRA